MIKSILKGMANSDLYSWCYTLREDPLHPMKSSPEARDIWCNVKDLNWIGTTTVLEMGTKTNSLPGF